MKIRAIIVDDEPDARESIRLIVKQFYDKDLEIIDSVSSVKEAVRSINSLKPDMVFLDIEMPNESGIKLFDYFGHNLDFEVVFITAYQEYALTAFKLAALDYLLKPVDYKQLGETIDRFKKHNVSYSKLFIDNFVNNLSIDLDMNKNILFNANQGYNILKISSILYCKADSNYSVIYTLDGKSISVASTLKEIEERLPVAVFFRTHKSFLVNLTHVRRFDRMKNELSLDNDKVVEVSKRRVAELENILKNL